MVSVILAAKHKTSDNKSQQYRLSDADLHTILSQADSWKTRLMGKSEITNFEIEQQRLKFIELNGYEFGVN